MFVAMYMHTCIRVRMCMFTGMLCVWILNDTISQYQDTNDASTTLDNFTTNVFDNFIVYVYVRN